MRLRRLLRVALRERKLAVAYRRSPSMDTYLELYHHIERRTVFFPWFGAKVSIGLCMRVYYDWHCTNVYLCGDFLSSYTRKGDSDPYARRLRLAIVKASLK